MTPAQQLQAELAVIGMDASRNLMSDFHPLLAELGVTAAQRLSEVTTGQSVLVAGAKVAISTPPVLRSNRRVIFTTLDDGTGLVDLVFFHDSQEAVAYTVFHCWLVVVRGTLQRRGARSISIVGSRAWEPDSPRTGAPRRWHSQPAPSARRRPRDPRGGTGSRPADSPGPAAG
jgi:error-prone DNA polymerase